jgi:hypothetical protein
LLETEKKKGTRQEEEKEKNAKSDTRMRRTTGILGKL